MNAFLMNYVTYSIPKSKYHATLQILNLRTIKANRSMEKVSWYPQSFSESQQHEQKVWNGMYFSYERNKLPKKMIITNNKIYLTVML